MHLERDGSGRVVRIKMLRPSNFHAHLRLGALMRAIASHVMVVPKYLLVMPNDGLIDSLKKVVERHDTLRGIAEEHGFPTEFVMTLYLTGNVAPQVIEAIAGLPFRVEVKYYPPEQGATTGSGHGVHLAEASETLRAMSEHNVPLLGHFESVRDKNGRILSHALRETYFMKHTFPWLRETYPELHISIEHASTAEAIEHVRRDRSGNTVCTITPHHMLLSIEELRALSWANQGKCMPIPKSLEDTDACREFATSGDSRAIAGDDTAAHLSRFKLGAFENVANGCFWTAHSIAAYASAFEKAGALDNLEAFMSLNGARWRGLECPAEDDRIALVREEGRDIPQPVPVREESDWVIPWGYATEEAGDRMRLGWAVEQC